MQPFGLELSVDGYLQFLQFSQFVVFEGYYVLGLMDRHTGEWIGQFPHTVTL